METASIYERAFVRLAVPESKINRALQMLLVTASVALGVIGLILPIRFLSPSLVPLKDFVQEYVLSRAILEGVDPYQPVSMLAQRYLGMAAGQPHPSPHPPTVGILFLPFAPLDYGLAASIWFGLEIVWLAASIYFLARSCERWLPVWVLGVVMITILGWEPIIGDLALGQLMILLLLLLVGVRSALLASHPVIAGSLLGLAILVKPIPWPLFLVLVLYRYWRAVVACLVTVLAGHLAAGFVVGYGTILTYYGHVLPIVNEGYRNCANNTSLWTIGWRAFDGTGSQWCALITAPPAFRSEWLAMITSAMLPLLVLLVGCFTAKRMGDSDSALGLMVIVSVLISPVMWTHYQILAVIPITQVITLLVSRRLPSKETTLALLIIVLLWIPYNTWVALAHLVAGQIHSQSGEYVMPLLPAGLTMGRSVVMGALGLLVAVSVGGKSRVAQP